MADPLDGPVRSRPQPTSSRYAAFISYRHTEPDRRWAEWLHRALETYRVPEPVVATGAPRRLGRVFRDEEELAASAELSEGIDEALRQARSLIVVCSPRTPESRWVNEEARRFQEAGGADRVLALLVDGEPEDAFPPALRATEPLAADVRFEPGESRRAVRRIALLKLVASLLEVPFDSLRRRDEERARRRLIWLTSGALVVSLAFLGLALFAWQQWQRAEEELRVSTARNLAAQAQIANAASGIGAPGPERGVLLALESLRTHLTVVGDRVLRESLRLLPGAALEVALDDDSALLAVLEGGELLVLEGEHAIRVFDRSRRSFRDPTPGEVAGLEAQVRGGEPATDAELARSADGAYHARVSEEGFGGWYASGVDLHRGGDGKRLAALPHEWFPRLALFSSDNRWLATVTGTASLDAEEPSATVLVGSTVRVFEIPSGRLMTEMSVADEGGFGSLALGSEGDWLATEVGSPGVRSVLLWPLWPDLVRAEACRHVGRNLSPSEWETYVGTGAWRETCPGLPVKSE